jgi:hypothetical protein
MEDRWETLEACEQAVRDEGRIRVQTENLSLVEVRKGGLIRVGSPPRSEFVDWRYGPRLSGAPTGPGLWARFLSRLLARLPEPPPGGYDPYRGILGAVEQAPWLASPFLDSASSLTYLFSHLPLAPDCPSCARPLAIRPWEFQRLRLTLERTGPVLLVRCAFCGEEVLVSVGEARPVLRLGLGVVTPPGTLRSVSTEAATVLDSSGDPERFIATLSGNHPTLGDMGTETRAGLLIALDEAAEAEALESEWREAEELAAIVDGELSDVPGFDDFRREILREED